MISVLLQTAVPYILFLQGILSIFFILRGHNLPGGGFIAGLLMAAGFVLYSIAYDVDKAREKLKIKPETLLWGGLTLALFSSLISTVFNIPFMTSLWMIEIDPPGFDKISIGTPFLFDVGIFSAVTGMTLLVVFRLFEVGGKAGKKWK